MLGSVLDPLTSGVVKADNRGNEKFDVLQGIPTSESLYTNVFAFNYLYKQNWVQMSGKITYSCSVTVTYTRQWQESQPDICFSSDEGGTVCVPQPPRIRQDSQNKPYHFTIERSYSYWQINNLELYSINRAVVSNYALPGGSVTMIPAEYTPPTLQSHHDANVNNHVYPAASPTITYSPPVVQGGLDFPPSLPDDTGILKGMAERTPDPQVKNDLVKFNGSSTMSDALTTRDGSIPRNIPSPTTIGQNVLYKSGNIISKSLVNRANTPSAGTIYYDLLSGNVGGGSNLSFPIQGINTVTVHTPVVNYATVSDDQTHNQKTNPTAGRSAIILDRPFSVTIPTSGQHRSIPGYGNRDYGKYIKDKQIWFPFDVYTADKSTFIPKETWTSIPVSQERTTFFLPVWVDEGNYEVLFRTFAENSPSSGFTAQMNANLDLTNHVATQVVPVEVIGRLYDFKITDIADYNWEKVFRTQHGSSTPTGTKYWVGTNGIDGSPRGNSFPFVLPIRQGSNPLPGMMNIAVKTGYHFKFEVTTKGNMFGSQDGIRMTPTFTFVDKTGSNRQPVDLYYHTNDQKFVRIGSSDDLERRYVTLDARLRNVPQQELTDTAASLWSLSGNTGSTRESYIDKYLKNAKKPTYVGGYDVLILPPPLRTFIGSMSVPTGVSAARANASVQLWRGEYSLPAAPYVVPKGIDLAVYGKSHQLDDNAPVFLKNGYIIVNFNIETIRNQDLDHPNLQYIHAPLSNQWQMEGFQRSFTDPYGVSFQVQDGDVIFYNADQSSYDDFGAGGTH
ncbi:hypothetical protein B5M42_020900 [Paenibacillus athensensis]|uniref:DUF5704 domain-containing protein n=2 Tax=Paenibacillus athensensis TaxID=1967502 RepID=A0A4Y8PZY3_9BACL|nr:hypothetical protein [Paenibacillus athensensis]